MKFVPSRSLSVLVLSTAAFAQGLVPEVIYYKFNEAAGAKTALNEANPGAGSTFAPVTGFTFGPGMFGNGLVGTGATGAAQNVNTGYTLALNGSSFTVEFWYRPAAATALTYLCGVPTGGSFRIFTPSSVGGNISMTGSGLGSVLATGAMPPVGTWVHLAFVFDASTTPPTATPYVNGVPGATTNQTGTLTLNTGSFMVGSQLTGSAGLNGTMDEFRLWLRARTAAEIATSYTSELFDLNLFSATTSGGGVGDLTLNLTQIDPIAIEGFTFISGTPTATLGGGPAFGILPDAVTWPILFVPAAPGNPLHFLIGTPGVYPAAPLSVPAGTLAFLSGQTYDMVTVLFAPNLAYASRSQVQRVVW
jgi:hypothetical protein